MRCSITHPRYGQCALEEGHECKHEISKEEREAHRCHARGCSAKVKPEMLMCFKHWKMVPRKLQIEVWKYYRVGQCDDKGASRDWLKAADACIDFVSNKEKNAKSSN